MLRAGAGGKGGPRPGRSGVRGPGKKLRTTEARRTRRLARITARALWVCCSPLRLSVHLRVLRASVVPSMPTTVRASLLPESRRRVVRYRFLTADVFTDAPFTGNQLAVFPEAAGLPAPRMQQIAREFNFPESVFVLPPDAFRLCPPVAHLQSDDGDGVRRPPDDRRGARARGARRDPAPRADRPTCCSRSAWGPCRSACGASRAARSAHACASPSCRRSTPAPDAAALAAMLSLAAGDLVGGGMAPAIVSCGMPFVMVPVRSSDAVGSRPGDAERFAATLAGCRQRQGVRVRVERAAGTDIHARMFSPAIGIPEDPATGSAAVALGGYLAAREPRREGRLRLEHRAGRRDGAAEPTRRGGGEARRPGHRRRRRRLDRCS